MASGDVKFVLFRNKNLGDYAKWKINLVLKRIEPD